VTNASSQPVLRPDWSAPVGALCSTRAGGVSTAPWAGLNLGDAVGDDPAAVAENRRRFASWLEGARPVWMRQVHGTRVLHLTPSEPHDLDAEPPEADAAWTDARGLACVVQVADCMPVLLAAADGRAVAAAHAGWRGLAAGVLESTLAALREGAGVPPSQVDAWIGPCIGPRRFEVGPDVLAALGEHAPSGTRSAFLSRPRPDGSPRWLADLPALARARLQAAGARSIAGGAWCTADDGSRFFSYRRDGVTGRMAACVWRR
jgi:YfiH family protein